MAQRTSKSTEIAASAAEVLDVVAELAQYPSWAGGIKRVDVLEEVDGWPVRARFSVDQPPISDTYVLEYTWQVDETGAGRVSWVLDEAGSVITKLDGSYDLVETGARTAVTYNLSVDISIPLPGMIKRQAEKRIVSTALEDLSKRVTG